MTPPTACMTVGKCDVSGSNINRFDNHVRHKLPLRSITPVPVTANIVFEHHRVHGAPGA